MAIQSVHATAVRIPLRRATRMATRDLGARDYLLIEVRCSDTEAVGTGYAYAGTSGGPLLAEAAIGVLAPLLVGTDGDDIHTHWERMYQESLLAGRRGAVIRALSAVDIALWDLSAKRRRIPLAAMLGGSPRRAVPAYASGGYYRPDDGDWAHAVSAEIAYNTSLGFTDHKIKVGGLTVAEDARRVAAAVEVLEPGGRLALDANNAYRSVPEALRAIRAFEEASGSAGLWWVEEPLSPEDVAGHARLTRTVETAIATGEIHQTRWDFRRLLDAEAVDIVQPDVGVVGGITEWLRVARMAEGYGVAIAPHWHANAHAPLAAAVPGCIGVEHFALDKDIYNFERLLTSESRLICSAGAIVPDAAAPGLGVTLDVDAVASFTIGTSVIPARTQDRRD